MRLKYSPRWLANKLAIGDDCVTVSTSISNALPTGISCNAYPFHKALPFKAFAARSSACRAAGFIGSNLLEELFLLDQEGVEFDNFSSGRRWNLDEVRRNVGERARSRFRFIDGDIRNRRVCKVAAAGDPLPRRDMAGTRCPGTA